MGEEWVTSWYWRWRRLDAPPPSVPLSITDERAQRLAGMLDAALAARDDGGPLFLALSHARLLEAQADASANGVRVDYRVAPKVRFPDADSARGAAQRANAHITRLETRRQLGPTRGPFHLSEIIAQGGLALVTLRSDVLTASREPRLGAYVPVAFTRGGGPLEPMQLGLLDAASWRVVWAADDVVSRAWHAPLAGGEILALLPATGLPPRRRSGLHSVARVPSGIAGPDAPTLEMDAPPAGGRERR